jgi:NADH-quinone oxidoreductase subunit M
MDTNPKVEGHKDINIREIMTLVPLIVLVFWIGVYPNTFLSFMDVSVQNLIDRVNTAGLIETEIAQHGVPQKVPDFLGGEQITDIIEVAK